MGKPALHQTRTILMAAAAALAGLVAVPAGAATLHDLSNSEFANLYGDYAPGGDCNRQPLVRISKAGFEFRSGGQVSKTASFEYAPTFFGPDYHGISYAFFPFPQTADEPGHVLLYANADEVPGTLQFTDNLGPGEVYTPLESRLVKSSPMRRCRKAT